MILGRPRRADDPERWRSSCVLADLALQDFGGRTGSPGWFPSRRVGVDDALLIGCGFAGRIGQVPRHDLLSPGCPVATTRVASARARTASLGSDCDYRRGQRAFAAGIVPKLLLPGAAGSLPPPCRRGQTAGLLPVGPRARRATLRPWLTPEWRHPACAAKTSAGVPDTSPGGTRLNADG